MPIADAQIHMPIADVHGLPLPVPIIVEARISRMPGVKRGRDDTDNEEADQDSDSDHSSVDAFEVSDGSESEESSELDEQECDERRMIYTTDVTDLERQFTLLREQLYRERLHAVEQRLSAVRAGEAAEYLAPLNQLREAYTIRLEVASVTRTFRINNCKNKHEAELLAAKQNYENEKVLLMCSLKEDIQEKISLLQDDRNNVSVTSEVWAQQNLRRSPRTPHQSFPQDGESPRRRKPTTVEGPYIVYRLREEDILEDWTLIRRAVQASKQRKNKFCKISSPRPIGQGFGL